MSASHGSLVETVLRDALTDRARGDHAASELVRDVHAAIETLPQGPGWTWPRVTSRRMLPVVLVAAVLPALVAGLLLAGASPSPDRPSDGEIAYVRATYECMPGQCERLKMSDRIPGLRAVLPTIVASDPGAASARTLVPVPGDDHRPTGWAMNDPRNNVLAGPQVAWSPEGERIAFRTFTDAPGIYLVDRDGSNLRRLVELREDRWDGIGWTSPLAWSPDGGSIAYTYPYGGVGQTLSIVDTASGRVVELPSPATRLVAWSPDGRRLAFAQTWWTNTTRLFVVDTDGTNEVRLEAAEVDGYHISAIDWSPDGSTIAFVRVTDSRTPGPSSAGLWVIAPDGFGLRHVGPAEPDITENGGCCVHMAGDGILKWSPDGTRLARIDWVDDLGNELVITDADGADERPLSHAYTFDWSPEGDRLVFADGPRWWDGWDDAAEVETDPWSQVFVIDVDGTDRRLIGSGEFPDWSS